MSGWVYAFACVVVPALWGVVMYFAFEAVDRRRRARIRKDLPPPIDYSI